MKGLKTEKKTMYSQRKKSTYSGDLYRIENGVIALEISVLY